MIRLFFTVRIKFKTITTDFWLKKKYCYIYFVDIVGYLWMSDFYNIISKKELKKYSEKSNF